MKTFVDGWVECGRCGMEILFSGIRRDDNGIFVSLIWNAEGGRSSTGGGEEISFRVVVEGCFTLINGECNEWSIFGGGDAGGVRTMIGDSWLSTVVENDSDRNAGFRGRGRLVILIEKVIKSCKEDFSLFRD